MLGAWFLATEPLGSPITPLGVWIFGALVGALTVVIRVWGGLPEGVMYAILLANATTPILDRVTRPRPFGHGKGAG
jgi:electron transport complex protein RnfD